MAQLWMAAALACVFSQSSDWPSVAQPQTRSTSPSQSASPSGGATPASTAGAGGARAAAGVGNGSAALQVGSTRGPNGTPRNPTVWTPVTLEILRDRFGVPHVFASTDRDAYYGLGWACAQDRFLQMSYVRLGMQGRMAEVFGPDSGDGSNEFVTHDVRMRLFGYRRLSQELAAGLDAETAELLGAYADGVNDFVQSPGALLHPLFATTAIPIEPWTPADCILMWMRLSRFFGGSEPTKEASVRHTHDALVPTLGVAGATAAMFIDQVLDEASAVVQQSDVPPAVQAAMSAYAAQFGLPGPNSGPSLLEDGAHFSHAWAVSGSRTTSGRAVLVGEPRLPLRNPNTLWEAHVVGASFEARGAGVAGSPNLFIGSTANVAWSVTAVSLDQADLFEIVADPADPTNRYLLDGRSLPFTSDSTETVLVAGQASTTVRYRETVWGPVITEYPGDSRYLVDVQPNEQFALKWVGRALVGGVPTAGWLAAYRAADAAEFGAALGGINYPGINCVFADAAGSVGYWLIGALPLRADLTPLGGRASVDGSVSSSDWLDIIPHDLKPWVIDPAAGFVYSGNHLPVGGWYPMPFVHKGGHTARSRRLRESLDDLLPTPQSVVHPSDVVALHEDGAWTRGRDVVLLGLHLRDDQLLVEGQPFQLQADARSVLSMLETWADTGGDGASVSDVPNDGQLSAAMAAKSALARWVGVLPFRTPAAGGVLDPAIGAAHGQGDSGFEFFLRERIEGIQSNPPVDLNLADATWIDHVLAQAWSSAHNHMGAVSNWANWFQTTHLTSTVKGWVDLEGFPSLDPSVTTTHGPVTVAFGQTVLSQFQQSYTQVVEPGRPDVTRSLLPGGEFENPASNLRQPVYDDQLNGWLQSPQNIKPAPLSRNSINAVAGPTFSTVLISPYQP